MKKKLLPIFLFLLGSFSTIQAQSPQLFVDNSYTVEQMIMDFFDCPSISISNISSSGAQGVAFFEATQTDLGLDAGILLTTGNPFDAVGPNTVVKRLNRFRFAGR